MNTNLRDLPIEQRIRLVEDLWDSIAAEQHVLLLTEEQKAVLDQRLDAYEADGKRGRLAQEGGPHKKTSMSLEVRLRQEAEEDLADAATWYEAQRRGLGNDFLDQALATFAMIAKNPIMFPAVHRNTRRALLHKFPFGIYYRNRSRCNSCRFRDAR